MLHWQQTERKATLDALDYHSSPLECDGSVWIVTGVWIVDIKYVYCFYLSIYPHTIFLLKWFETYRKITRPLYKKISWIPFAWISQFLNFAFICPITLFKKKDFIIWNSEEERERDLHLLVYSASGCGSSGSTTWVQGPKHLGHVLLPLQTQFVTQFTNIFPFMFIMTQLGETHMDFTSHDSWVSFSLAQFFSFFPILCLVYKMTLSLGLCTVSSWPYWSRASMAGMPGKCCFDFPPVSHFGNNLLTTCMVLFTLVTQSGYCLPYFCTVKPLFPLFCLTAILGESDMTPISCSYKTSTHQPYSHW